MFAAANLKKDFLMFFFLTHSVFLLEFIIDFLVGPSGISPEMVIKLF